MAPLLTVLAAGVAAGWACWAVAAALVGGERPAWSRRGLAGSVGSGAALGVLVMVAAARADDPLAAALPFLLVASPLLVTLLTDLLARLVYPLVLAPGLIAALALAAREPGALAPAIISGAGAGAVAALLVALARWCWPDVAEPPLGGGEILIAAAAGAMLGPAQTLRALFAGMVLAAVVAGALLLTGRAERGDPIPYGVFLCAASMIALAL